MNPSIIGCFCGGGDFGSGVGYQLLASPMSITLPIFALALRGTKGLIGTMNTAFESCADASQTVHTEPSPGEDHNEHTTASKGSADIWLALVPGH